MDDAAHFIEMSDFEYGTSGIWTIAVWHFRDKDRIAYDDRGS